MSSSAGPSVPESTSQALVKAAKPPDSKPTSPNAEISTLEETRPKTPVVNLEHPKTENELPKEPPLSSIEKSMFLANIANIHKDLKILTNDDFF
jgi:hypothetical protein